MSFVAVAIGVSAAGLLLGTYSTYQQGQAMAKQSAYNALIAQQNANLAARKAESTQMATGLAADQFARQTRILKSAQRAQYAAAGVEESGTPLYVAAETQRQADINELARRYAGSVELSNVLSEKAKGEQQSTLYQMQGSQYKTAGMLGAGGSLLTGLGSAAGMYALSRNSTPTSSYRVGSAYEDLRG